MVAEGARTGLVKDISTAHAEAVALIGPFGPGHGDLAARFAFQLHGCPSAEVFAHIHLDHTIIQHFCADGGQGRLHDYVAGHFFRGNDHILGRIDRGSFPVAVVQLRGVPSGQFLIGVIKITAELMPYPLAQQIAGTGMRLPGGVGDPAGFGIALEGQIRLSHDDRGQRTVRVLELRERDPAHAQPEHDGVLAFFQIRGDVVSFITDVVSLQIADVRGQDFIAHLLSVDVNLMETGTGHVQKSLLRNFGQIVSLTHPGVRHTRFKNIIFRLEGFVRADPAGRPVAHFHRAHHPGGRLAPLAPLAVLVSDTHTPETVHGIIQRRARVVYLSRVAAVHDARIPQIRIILFQQSGIRGRLDLICCLAQTTG